MKKWGILLLTLMILCHFSCPAEGISVSVSIGSEGEGLNADFSLLVQDSTLSLFSSLCPGWVFQADLKPGTPYPFPGDPRLLKETVEKSWNDWCIIAGMETDRGVYTGDLFETAAERKQIRFSWSELSMLLTAAESQEWPAGTEEIPAALFHEARKALTRLALEDPGILFELDLYDEIKTFSLTAFRGNETIGTLSAKQETDTCIQLVAGYAENGRTYYRTLEITSEAPESLLLTACALADDRGYGYKNLPRNAVILREELLIDGADSGNIRLNYSSVSGNDSVPFLKADGTITRGDGPVWQLNAVVRYGNDEAPFASIQASGEAAPVPENARVADLLHLQPEMMTEVQNQILNSVPEWMIRLFQAMPPELVLQWLNNRN